MTNDKTIHAEDDPLGDDTRDFWKAARQMAEDALAGRHEEAVREEFDAVRKRWAKLPKSTPTAQ
ncbi:hypothetical protein C3Y89_24315 [Rhizobium sp. UPM1132]|nr:hypothetical protein [Rhizobium ruizarguesonis]